MDRVQEILDALKPGARITLQRNGKTTEHVIVELGPSGALTVEPWPDDPGSYSVHLDQASGRFTPHAEARQDH